jgi:hypothetical protein
VSSLCRVTIIFHIVQGSLEHHSGVFLVLGCFPDASYKNNYVKYKGIIVFNF